MVFCYDMFLCCDLICYKRVKGLDVSAFITRALLVALSCFGALMSYVTYMFVCLGLVVALVFGFGLDVFGYLIRVVCLLFDCVYR